MFGAPTISSDGGAGWCPFVGPRCPWPCPPNCQCPGECPMDVAESEDAMEWRTVDATDYGHPFPGGPQSWPCSSSCRCPEGCAMDVDEPDAMTSGRDAPGDDRFASADQPYCWPESVTNAAYEEWYATDFTASFASCSGANAPDDNQFSSWSYSVTNNVHQAQCSDDGPTYDEVVDDDDCSSIDFDLRLVGATTDNGSGSESDSSGEVIIIV